MHVKMTEGAESALGPGEVMFVPSGHEPGFVGNEPAVVIDPIGATDHAEDWSVRLGALRGKSHTIRTALSGSRLALAQRAPCLTEDFRTALALLTPQLPASGTEPPVDLGRRKIHGRAVPLSFLGSSGIRAWYRPGPSLRP
jgi:hypothetical protein